VCVLWRHLNGVVVVRTGKGRAPGVYDNREPLAQTPGQQSSEEAVTPSGAALLAHSLEPACSPIPGLAHPQTLAPDA
jgi:hypothetical protein